MADDRFTCPAGEIVDEEFSIHWRYADWFEPALDGPDDPSIDAAERYVVESRIEDHPFFSLAASSPTALRAWVTQELVVTGPVAQCMLRVGLLLRNVHLRAMMMTVAWGEHSPVRRGIARRSHPWLLDQLRASIDLPIDLVSPFRETIIFLRDLEAECNDPLRGVAAIGMGNERLIIPEYGAVRSAFSRCYPSSEYAPFLDANISEDTRHSQLLSTIASQLIQRGADANSYLDASRRAVDSRIHYYDRLLDRFS